MDFFLKPISSTATKTSSNGNAKSSDGDVLQIKPNPGFVLKTKILSVNSETNSVDIQAGKKLFINICHADEIPTPSIEFNAQNVNLIFTSIINNHWEIPILTSSIRSTTDKKNDLSFVCECCINTKCYEWINENSQLREILIEWCFESIELREMLKLDRDTIKFPKMHKKGDDIPDLNLLKDDLNMEKNLKDSFNKTDDPSNIIKLKRDLLMEENDDDIDMDDVSSMPPLFPMDTSSQTNGEVKKPLIQEISDTDRIQHQQINKNSTNVPIKRKDLDLDVSMRRTNDTSKYKMKIEIFSIDIKSSLDISLNYDKDNNTLIVKNKNLLHYNEKIIKIPLPNEDFVKLEKFKCFFTQKDNKLNIFI